MNAAYGLEAPFFSRRLSAQASHFDIIIYFWNFVFIILFIPNSNFFKSGLYLTGNSYIYLNCLAALLNDMKSCQLNDYY